MIIDNETRIILEKELIHLAPRYKKCIYGYFGINQEPKSKQQLSEELNIKVNSVDVNISSGLIYIRRMIGYGHHLEPVNWIERLPQKTQEAIVFLNNKRQLGSL